MSESSIGMVPSVHATNIRQNRHPWLDVVRGLSALAVCAEHLRAAIFVDYQTLEHTSHVDRAFYFLTSLGHQSVMIFFVLSGFLVGGSVLSKGENFRWLPYAIARLSRLWVVLIPALLLTLGIDLWFQSYAPEIVQGAWQGMWRSGPNPDGSWSIGVDRFLANVFFLQTIETPVYGSNMPLWSLANEFWYYVLFPLAVAATSARSSRRMKAAYALMIVLLCFWLPIGMLALFPVWLMGAAAWWISRRPIPAFTRRMILLLGTGFLLGSLIVIRNPIFSMPHGLARDLPVGFAFAVMLIGLARAKMDHPTVRWMEGTGRRLSDLSYSLYLCHLPLILALSWVFIGRAQLRPSVVSYALFLGFLAIQVFIARLLWLMFERHTDLIRTRLLDLFNRGCAFPKP